MQLNNVMHVGVNTYTTIDKCKVCRYVKEFSIMINCSHLSIQKLRWMGSITAWIFSQNWVIVYKSCKMCRDNSWSIKFKSKDKYLHKYIQVQCNCKSIRKKVSQFVVVIIGLWSISTNKKDMNKWIHYEY